MPRSSRWRSGLGLFLWAGLITASSNTVILRREWFAWINAHVLTDDTSRHQFALFWGASWFAIVKGWHAVEFAILFLLTRMALDRISALSRQRNRALAGAFSLLFAASDEYHQTFIAGRGGTWTDVAIDGLGISLAALISEWQQRRQFSQLP